MFNPFKKLFSGSTPQPVFATVGAPQSIQLVPTTFGDYKDPATDVKPRLLNRVLEGLPGFLGGAGAVMAAKGCAAALCATTSAPALLGGAAVLSAGAIASQTVSYIRERRAELKIQHEKGRLSEASWLDTAKRETKAFGQELKSARFWKGAATKGVISGGLGAAFGLAASTETAQNVIHLAKEKLSAGLSNVAWKNPFQRVAEMVSGKAHADFSQKPEAALQQIAQTADTKPAVQLSHPLEQVSIEPPTPLEKIRILMDVKGTTSNVALDKMISRAESGDMQAVKDLAMGLNNGKLGLPMHKTLGMELLRIAAEGKNPQAIRDLAFMTKGTVAASMVDTQKPSSILTERSIDEGVRERAAAFIRGAIAGTGEAAQPAPAAKVAVPQATAPAPAPTAPLPTSEIVNRNADTLARAYDQVKQTAGNVHSDPAAQFAHDYALNKAPGRVADEASRCIQAVGEAGKRTIHTMCSIWKDVVTPDDKVIMQSADQSLSATYSPESTQPTSKFTDEARKHFRTHDFMPKYGAQLQ